MDSKTFECVKDVDSNTNGTLCEKNTARIVESGSNDISRRNRRLSESSTVSNSVKNSGSTLPEPPDGGWGWVVVFASFMVNFIVDGVSLSFGILFVDFVDYFESSKSKTAWIGSIFISMPLFVGPIASYLIDRFGCQRMCMLGGLMSSIAFLVSFFTDSLELLFLIFSIAGFGNALCYVTSTVIVAYYFKKKLSLASGIAVCGTGIGTFIFPPLTAYLLDLYGWRGTLLILSGLFLNNMVFGALMRDLECPNVKRDEKLKTSDCCALDDSKRQSTSLDLLPSKTPNNTPSEVMSEPSSKEDNLESLLTHSPHQLDSRISKETNESYELTSLVLGDSSETKYKPENGEKNTSRTMLNDHSDRLKASSCPQIYESNMVTSTEEKTCMSFRDLKKVITGVVDISNFKSVGFTIFCISNFLLYACVDSPYVYIPDYADTIGIELDDASYLISILGVLNCLGVVVVGYIGDKPWMDPSILYSGFITISGVSLIIFPLILNYYAFATLSGVYGFTISANYTLIPVILIKLVSLDKFTGAYGLLLLVQGIGGLIGPPAAGLLFDMSGTYDITFFCIGICVVVSGIMVIFVAKRLRCWKKSSRDINAP